MKPQCSRPRHFRAKRITKAYAHHPCYNGKTMNLRSRVLLPILILAAARGLAAQSDTSQPFNVVGTTIAETQQALRDGRTTCRAIVESYLRRIQAYDQTPFDGLRLHAIVVLNPHVLAEAD